MTYLAHVFNTRVNKVRLENVLVVQNFSNMFLDELPWLPPERETDVSIDLILRTKSISLPPYIMALVELKELKICTT